MWLVGRFLKSQYIVHYVHTTHTFSNGLLTNFEISVPKENRKIYFHASKIYSQRHKASINLSESRLKARRYSCRGMAVDKITKGSKGPVAKVPRYCITNCWAVRAKVRLFCSGMNRANHIEVRCQYYLKYIWLCRISGISCNMRAILFLYLYAKYDIFIFDTWDHEFHLKA